jgi:hypothetical protein
MSRARVRASSDDRSGADTGAAAAATGTLPRAGFEDREAFMARTIRHRRCTVKLKFEIQI